MSDLLASVKRSFYHEVLSYSDAEQRLEGKNGGYLFRESNVKPGMFILSYVRKSSVAHVLVPNKNRKFISQPLEEAVEIAADVIAASELRPTFKSQISAALEMLLTNLSPTLAKS